MEMLRSEEEQKTGQMRQMIEQIERNISSMSETIRVLEEEMGLEDLSILHVSLYILRMGEHACVISNAKLLFPLFQKSKSTLSR